MSIWGCDEVMWKLGCWYNYSQFRFRKLIGRAMFDSFQEIFDIESVVIDVGYARNALSVKAL